MEVVVQSKLYRCTPDGDAVVLTRLATGDSYRVDKWRCSCPAFQFSRTRPKSCKHFDWFRARTFRQNQPPLQQETTPVAATNTATKTPAPPIEAEVVNGALATVPPQRPAPANLAQQLASKPTLLAALLKAASEIGDLKNDAYNEYHKYDYTSSEAVISAARKVLIANGVLPLTLRLSVNGHEREGADRFELHREMMLQHTSGESILIVNDWPIMPGTGRPLDKAAAAADTLSLRYFFRGLLMIACKDPEPEVAARDDTKAAPQQKAPEQKPAAPKKDDAPPPPKDGDELLARVQQAEKKMVRAGRCAEEELFAHVERWAAAKELPSTWAKWPAEVLPEAAQLVRDFLRAHPAPAKTEAPAA